VSAVAAHSFSLQTAKILILAFFAFSLCASAAYVINDLCDRGHDRIHPRKKTRPIPSGSMGLLGAGLFAGGLFAASMMISVLALPDPFVWVLLGYFGLTLCYSIYLKRLLMIDVVVLACLYGLRVIAGGVAVSVVISPWLIAFCIFFFLGLALVKRIAELKTIESEGLNALAGRSYCLDDLPAVQSLAAAAGLVSILVFVLYLNSGAASLYYQHPARLWSAGLVLVCWFGRATLIASRGEMQDDPVIFALTDTPSLIAAILLLIIILFSI
jgi:4-hydroxybenzoate polyprenyltransferase